MWHPALYVYYLPNAEPKAFLKLHFPEDLEHLGLGKDSHTGFASASGGCLTRTGHGSRLNPGSSRVCSGAWGSSAFLCLSFPVCEMGIIVVCPSRAFTSIAGQIHMCRGDEAPSAVPAPGEWDARGRG